MAGAPDYDVPVNPDNLLMPGEAAAILMVDVKTVARWGDCGYLKIIRTIGRHRRFNEAQVRKLAKTRANGNPIGLRHRLTQ